MTVCSVMSLPFLPAIWPFFVMFFSTTLASAFPSSSISRLFLFLYFSAEVTPCLFLSILSSPSPVLPFLSPSISRKVDRFHSKFSIQRSAYISPLISLTTHLSYQPPSLIPFTVFPHNTFPPPPPPPYSSLQPSSSFPPSPHSDSECHCDSPFPSACACVVLSRPCPPLSRLATVNLQSLPNSFSPPSPSLPHPVKVALSSVFSRFLFPPFPFSALSANCVMLSLLPITFLPHSRFSLENPVFDWSTLLSLSSSLCLFWCFLDQFFLEPTILYSHISTALLSLSHPRISFFIHSYL